MRLLVFSVFDVGFFFSGLVFFLGSLIRFFGFFGCFFSFDGLFFVNLFDVGFYTNMISFTNGSVFKNPSSLPADQRFQRPYEGWSSRVQAASVPDGLSMTAVLAEKLLSTLRRPFSTPAFGRRTVSTSSYEAPN